MFKQLFCKHNYVKRKTELREVPYNPTFTCSWRYNIYEISICSKCGKIKEEFVGTR